MKRKIAVILFLLCCTSFLPLNAQWAKTYGGSEDDYAYSIQQTNDGGYIVAGVTESYGDEWGDFWILKLASNGIIEWQKTSGWLHMDKVRSIQQTNDGGYVVGGYTGYTWILKFSSDGDIEWQREYGGIFDVFDYRDIYSIQQTTDGGYISVCETVYFGPLEHDISVFKFSSDGSVEWNKTYGGIEYDYAYSIQQTNDGGYVVAGETESFGAGGSDIWILKLASDGSIEWQKTYGGNYPEGSNSIQQTSDGGYVVAGKTSSFGSGSSDIWVLKLASDGSIEWQKTYGGSLGEESSSIQQTGDGGYVVAGETSSFGAGSSDIWILKLASDGTIEWQKTYGGSQGEEASSIQQTSDGGYVVAGSTDTYGAGMKDFLILKLSSNGNIDPSCYLVNESNADVSDSSVSPTDTDIIPEILDITLNIKNITPQDSDALVYSLCSGQHTLSLSATSGGTTNPQPGTYVYDYATRISIRAIPDDEYHFSEWSGDGSGTDNQLSITMDSDKSIQANFVGYTVVWEEAKKTPCFIATAAYESPSHPHVRILRDFRDKCLMTNELGLKFIDVYYKYSPFVADIIETNKGLKVVVRIYLLPIVAICFSVVNFGPVMTGIMLFLFFAFPALFVFVFRKKMKRKKS